MGTMDMYINAIRAAAVSRRASWNVASPGTREAEEKALAEAEALYALAVSGDTEALARLHYTYLNF